ncbi:MAG: CBS domain-containing protein [Nitrospinae bacterium]|nr:CBS domain-containing protein [Nitrospinota bacterium]
MSFTLLSVGGTMSTNLVSIDVNNTVYDAAKLMKEKAIGSLVIKNGDATEGLITERDIVCKVVAEGIDAKEAKLEGYVNKSTENIDQEDSIFDARQLMLDKNVDYLLVQKDGKLVGIVSKHDLLKD